MITIKNEKLIVEISEKGAEIQSIKYRGTDYLWNGDPAFWTGRAPIMFPICGALKDNKYTYQGSEYTLSKHGFTRGSTFIAEEASKDRAVFLLKSDKDTMDKYPFPFEFRACFELLDNAISVTYSVKNLSENDMYFSVGAHEAYACPEGIEEYTICFDSPQTLAKGVLEGAFLTEEKTVVAENTKELPLNAKLFSEDALVFENTPFHAVTLKKNDGKRAVRVEFPEFDNVLIWQAPGAGYVCIEPWTGLPDFAGTGNDITKKKSISKLGGKKEFSINHKIILS